MFLVQDFLPLPVTHFLNRDIDCEWKMVCPESCRISYVNNIDPEIIIYNFTCKFIRLNQN